MSSLDIQALLTSRYGLHLSHVECLEILRGLGGTSLSDPEVAMKEDMTIRYQQMALQSIAQRRKKKIKAVSSLLPFSGKRNRDSENINVIPSSERGQEAGELSAGVDADPGAELRDDADIPEEYLDLVQILSILLIPVLAQAADQFRKGQQQQHTGEVVASASDNKEREGEETLHPKPDTLLKDVHFMLLKQIRSFGSEKGHKEDEDPDTPPFLEQALMEEILLECGETERAENTQLLQEMIEAATSSSGRLDLEAFVKALSSDLDLWPLESESRTTTFFFDVFGESRAQVNDAISVGRINVLSDSHDKAENDKTDDPEQEGDRQFGSFTKENSIDHSDIDFVVDIHASVVVMLVIWFFFLMASITYASIFQSLVSAPCVDEGRKNQFGCLLSSQLWNW